MRVIELREPVVSGNEVTFSWEVTPASDLYERTSCQLVFPGSVDLAAVPLSLWWRLELLCLHGHWPLLRPCRIVLPVRLPPGEVEFWLRLTDAAVATIETHLGREDTERKIEFAGNGPVLEPPTPTSAGRGVVSCFSGGRDGTTQAAILRELGESPTLVTVTSPVTWNNEHTTSRRRQVLAELPRRGGFEHIEVTTDFRSSWRNHFSWPLEVSVNELTDTFLYLSAAIAVAAARGSGLVLMASEAEVQESTKRGGMVIQMKHFMYSAATQLALSALFAPAGIEGIKIASLTSSLQQFQVQRLLSDRYADFRDLQYSCWELAAEEAACSQCVECRGIALNLAASGVPPAVAGIDLVKLLLAYADWEPGARYVGGARGPAWLPGVSMGRAHEMQELRCLAAAEPADIAALLDGVHTDSERERALEVYGQLRARAVRQTIEPEPGYRRGYLELLDGRLRDGVRSILEEHFEPAAESSYAHLLANTRLLSGWVAAPLGPGWAGVARRPSGGREPDSRLRPARATEAVTLSAAELEPFRELIPDGEPPLEQPPGGRLIRVADTLLDGNELDYVSQCVTDSWISSAGAFVARFEREFAAALGCRFGIACSSGTAALHLALAAAGVGSGDEVMLPAFTMIATANAARYVGAEPVLVDADPRTWNLDPAHLADKLTPRTRAIIAVHTYGQPADMEAIGEFAARNGLIVIEDAAEAHGARYRGRLVGAVGDAAAFSLYGNKILTTGEGGIVTTSDERIASLARELRDHAFSRERHFWHRRLGFNYRMTNLQAAVGVAQLERFGELVALRQRIAERYDAALAGIDGVELAPREPGGVTWMYGIRIGEAFGISRDELRRRLAARGVETRTFFVPLHLQPIYYRRFAGQRYPVAEALGRSGLYLPSGPRLTEEDVAYVAAAVREAATPVYGTTPTSA
jgi:perosamine synthetase